MDDCSYQVILQGTTRKGFDHSQVIKNLCTLFKLKPSVAEKLLQGEQRSVKKGLDYPSALKYRQVLHRAGAESRIEPESLDTARAELTERPGSDAGLSSEEERTVCPRCGYEPTSEYDVLVVRGDCPRCGLMVRSAGEQGRAERWRDESALSDEDPLDRIYGTLQPASWERRAFAAVYTFGAFLLIYCAVVIVFMSVFFPLVSIPSQVARSFFFVASNNFPIMLTGFSICAVTCVAPLFMGGRTWGQKAFGVVVLFRGEGGMASMVTSLALRSIAIGFVSYVPGFLFIRMWNALFQPLGHPLVAMAILALAAWVGAWIFGYRSPDKRGLPDIVAGTIQSEEDLLPRYAIFKACGPLAGGAGVLLLVGLILPYLLK